MTQPKRDVRAKKAEHLHKIKEEADKKLEISEKVDPAMMKKAKHIKRAAKPEVDPLKQAEFDPKDLGGLSRIEREAEVLQLDWAIRFPLLKPYEYLTIEKGYSVNQANQVLHESGGTSDWEMKRVEIQNKVTETVVKRHVDNIAQFNDTFIKGAKLGLAKAIEMMSKLGIEPAKDEHGKLIIDPRTKKPIYRGFRSIDLLNTLNSLKISQEIWMKSLGVSPGEGGMAQLIEKVTNLTDMQKREMTINQTNINLTMSPVRQEAEKKLETFVEKMSYEDIRTFVEYHREKKKHKVIEVTQEQAQGDGNGN